MSDSNNTPRNPGVPGGSRGSDEPTPDGGMALDDGRVQFAPREAEERDAATGKPNLQPSDDQIRDQVYSLMTGENWVDASEIDVHVNAGTVTLSGFVASPEDGRLAENIAQAVSTVHTVHNRLQVRSSGTDTSQPDHRPER